jgi:ABC-2 type transport system permease protein
MAAVAPYLWLGRLTFLKLMAYRMRYLTGIATYAVFVGGQYAIWWAVYDANRVAGTLAADGRIGGFTLAEIGTYLAVGYLARAAYFTNTDSDIAARIQSGDVTLDLLKPLSFHGQWLAQAAGETAFRILFFSLPMAVVMVPLFGVAAPVGDAWWQFGLLFLGAFWINAELNIMAGSMAAYLEDVTGLLSLKRNLLMLLTGLMVPLHFLPGWIATVCAWLPFAAIGSYPVLAYSGKLGTEGHPSFVVVFACALGWGIVLRAANALLWRYAMRRLEAQGG